jgi:hypothetical protein
MARSAQNPKIRISLEDLRKGFLLGNPQFFDYFLCLTSDFAARLLKCIQFKVGLAASIKTNCLSGKSIASREQFNSLWCLRQ